ncbi:MAG: class I SAM-dependent methyltransferase [Methanotrichaceae archaeon]
MSSYIGRHAELYDLFYKDKPYEQEASFIDQCIKKYGIGSSKRLLELACGTGSHAFALERLGYKVTATDYSEDMLNCARLKAAKISSSVDFQCQDMRKLDLPDKRFDVAICLFDSIGYVATNEALKNVFEGVYKRLRDGGLFIFEFWHAAAMLCGYDPLRIRRWQTPNGEILRISETSLESARQLAIVAYTIYELRKDGTYSCVEETQINRYFLMQEMAGFLSFSSFKPKKWFAGYTECEDINEDTWHILAVAQRL